MNTIHLEIVTPEGLIFSNDAKMVVLPGVDGEFGVLPGHASLVSLLQIGVVDIENVDGSRDAVAIDWGYAKIDENKISILVDGAVYVSGNSESDIAKSIENAKTLVKKMHDNNGILATALAKIENSTKAR
ncbi:MULTISPECIES: ATP synthase F1 subunit epsilon [Campylobacter]|uniref:ATP synthase epsilon chain n=1 Tax=Campylobacter vicugnae TaxID=1660076 RepID=A0A1X9SZX1_9BACT|nr:MULTISPECIES: ATP synthase F1 subunit epsilon [Campylobacter]MCR8690302.1 ATP synthase F1 subunit epsilon [Campylobacter sp. RM9264]MCR8701161.1 ATP synthase F1 subunit epsilon [Campylobacter sp. RM12176]ARR01773.1 ATP synthase, F1 complex, epsilon subunit [Campylobacter sp. RM8964]ARR03496.1 ATP synthase, F1 complex, epsilon subunit [Campylobacter sp. RM12175]MBE6430475.1 F0F1 ATP synthase subunit epsilon [Campylobacter sp.]